MRQTSQVIPIISVIVATRNRSQSLSQFLDGLRSLTEQPEWELIVANNGSDDDTETLLSKAAADLPIVVVNENLPGKSRALNKALRHARGDILLFTDDDIVPDPNWLEALYQASIEYPTANIFGGRILVSHERVPQWIVNSYNLRTILTSEQDLGRDIVWFADDQYPIGPNLAVRRRSIEKSSSLWPNNLGPGTKIPVGDERAFLMQVSRSESHDRLYVPESVVRHHVKGRELGFVNALRRCFLGGYAAGLVTRLRFQSSKNNKKGRPRVMWQRFRGASSSRELVCMIVRALGVLTGTVIPFARIDRG